MILIYRRRYYMIDLSTISSVEKLALVCLYFAQLKSSDERYANKRCTNALTSVANKYGFTYAKAKNDKDAFDALYDNGRKGWTDRPLEKRSKALFNVYEKYKNLSLDEIEKIAEKIIEEAEDIGKPYFSIKTKDADTVSAILSRNSNIEFNGLNILQDSLKLGQPVFIVLGGDKPKWETGLVGMGVISKEPFDIGYSGKNYRVKIDMKLLLDNPIKREDLLPYRDTYGIIGIGPIVKWEPNQALSQIQEKNAIALMRAMLELSHGIESDLDALIDEESLIRIKGAATKLVEVETEYGEDIKNSIATTLNMILREDEENEEYEEIVYRTGYTFVPEFERNRIVFGAPGTGKSYKLKEDCEELMNDSGGTYERVTFHPEYSYAHFVGTYKPISDENGDILYKFVPGPFIRVYVDALKSGRSGNPKPHLLLIEEINRSRVAGVFGDVFQLLDRDEDNVSEYDIQVSEDIKNHLVIELGGNPQDYDRIKIPDNMFIWATMNSADQGVFPMDTAFRRRWDFEYIGIDQNDAEIKGKIIIGSDIHALEVDWNKLRKAINEKLSVDYKINEDKLMGPFFLSKQIIETDQSGYIVNPEKFINAFKSKVIMYLYEDAAKQHRHKLFEGCDSSKYSSVCNDFDRLGIDIFGSRFRDIYNKQGV
jgi:hypothetical protein